MTQAWTKKLPLTCGFVQLGQTEVQSSAVLIQALYSADLILPGSSSKLRLLVINLASVPGGQLVNSPTAQSLARYMPFIKTTLFLSAIFFFGVISAYSQTQGEQEIAWIKDIYSKKYADTLYKKYGKTIKKENSHSYRFSDRILLTSGETNDLELLIMNGLFYPQLLTGDSTIKYSPEMSINPLMRLSQNDTLSIGGLQEVEIYPRNYQKKRFMLYVSRQGMMNPSLYTLELTNNTATATTPAQSFFKKASLTFMKFVSILI